MANYKKHALIVCLNSTFVTAYSNKWVVFVFKVITNILTYKSDRHSKNMLHLVRNKSDSMPWDPLILRGVEILWFYHWGVASLSQPLPKDRWFDLWLLYEQGDQWCINTYKMPEFTITLSGKLSAVQGSFLAYSQAAVFPNWLRGRQYVHWYSQYINTS